jgi:tetratricopeptide (TPR) repeat protein
MKKYLVILSLCIISVGCNNAAKPVAQNGNAVTSGSPDRSQTAIAHSSENQTPPPGNTGTTSHWKQSGDPIDTKTYDAAIASAEVAFKKKSDDAAVKKTLAEAYYKRGVALTDARQYASALGDYRRTVKYDPSNADAKGWIDKIIAIYDSMGREYPKEGEEPPPLSLEKGK